MWLREELTTDDDIMNKEFKSKVTVSSVGVNSAGIYKEDILNGADPVLKEGLIPVTINNEGKVTRADTNKKWYNYANQEWANAVILEDNYEDPGAGQEIPEEKIESYFVWIPRYKYKIWDEGKYSGLTTIENKVQTIQVVFESKDKKESKGNTINSWLTHPAFTAFNVNGLWVGKFETGFRGAEEIDQARKNPNTKADNGLEAAKNVVIKSNQYAWCSIQLANAFNVSYSYQRELDSHMMKNTEWGAVAYLQHSIYGSRKSVRINNNERYITGYAAKDEPTCGFTESKMECNMYEVTDKGNDGEYTYNYFNPLSVVASTTNNYTGIYDMSGGTNEYVMAGLESSPNSKIMLSGEHNIYNSGFNGPLSCPTCQSQNGSPNPNILEITDGIPLPEAKYYDLYSYNTSSLDFSKGILGDATGEMGPFGNITYEMSQRYISSWYNDYSLGISSNVPFFLRGHSNYVGTDAGIFAFFRETGASAYNRTFRIVLAI